MPVNARIALGVIGTACGAALLAACSTLPPAAPNRGTVSTSGMPAPATSTAVPAAAAQPPAPISNPSSGPSPCAADQLQLERAGNSAAMGHRAFAFKYTNVSGQACTLGGYPQVQALDANGNPVAGISSVQATRSYLVPSAAGSGPQPVAPGGSLWFVLTWSVVPSGNTPCPGMAAIQIALPPANASTAANAFPASGSSVAPPAAAAIPQGRMFNQVSSVCDGIHVMPLRAAPKQS
ncbi:MAG TPA: DUF4232 domain-containing protein [Nevskiaceae bacterium]